MAKPKGGKRPNAGRQKGASNLPREAHQAAFLTAYSQCGNITRAAEMVGLNRGCHNMWRRDDPTYLPRFLDAQEEACDRLEEEARRRAVDGTLKPVFQGGKEVGTIREFSDTLLIFLMKGVMPQKYRDNYKIEAEIKQDATHRWQPPEELLVDAAAELNKLLASRLTQSPNGCELN